MELAQIELVVFIEANRRKKKSTRCAGAHLTAGLVGKFAGSGDEVVVDVGFEGVGDAGAVVGRYLDVLVNVPSRVNYDAAPGLFRTNHVAVVGQALDSY